MYDVNDYGRMMADKVRMHAYTEALRRAVKPGSVVVDVGTGTGVFALLAAQFGARKVYAIDTNPCIQLAKATAKANGFADKIEFLQKSIFDVELPEQADVLIADCRGAFTLHERSLEIMIHARRFVRDGGTTIPLKDDLCVSVIEWPKVTASLEERWKVGGFDWNACRSEGFSSRLVAPDADLAGSTFLVREARWATVAFPELTSPNVRGRVAVEVEADGSAEFLALWFRSTTAAGLELTSGPFGNPHQVYTPLLLPLDPPLQVSKHESLTLEIDAIRARAGYLYAWAVRGKAGSRRQVSEGNAAHLLALNSGTERGTLAGK